MKTCCVIPVRLDSSRFPRKALHEIRGKPLLFWTWQQAICSGFFEEVIVATDSLEVCSLVNGWGGRFFLTSEKHNSGTERLLELYHSHCLSWDVWVNWQVDTILTTIEPMRELLSVVHKSDQDAVFSLYTNFFTTKDFYNQNMVKVVLDSNNQALYFSRAPIPFGVQKSHETVLQGAWRHIGIYAYTAKILPVLGREGGGKLESLEGLEQLSFLEKGVPIKMVYTGEGAVSVEVVGDMKKLEKTLG